MIGKIVDAGARHKGEAKPRFFETTWGLVERKKQLANQIINETLAPQAKLLLEYI